MTFKIFFVLFSSLFYPVYFLGCRGCVICKGKWGRGWGRRGGMGEGGPKPQIPKKNKLAQLDDSVNFNLG